MATYARERYNAPPQPPNNERFPDWIRGELGRVSRSIPHLGPTIDIRDFAVDGRGTHDDASEINKALRQLPTAGGTILLSPNAKYAVGSTLVGRTRGARIIGSGMPGKTVGAATVNGGTQIIGVTAGMTVMRWSGVDDDGTTFNQAGPVIEGVGFVDLLGQEDQIPGDMTLLEVRCANRWKLNNCGFFFAETGLKASKDTDAGGTADCAQWIVWGSTFTFCLTGAWLNTFTGTVDTSWCNGCGTGYKIEKDANNQQVSGVGIRGCKFDILEPTISTDFTPGIGIDIGLGQNIVVSECLFETQPETETPSTIGVNIDGDQSVTRVTVENSFFSNLYTDIDAVTARVVRVNNCTTRTGSATMTVNAHIDFTSVTDAVVVGTRSDGLSSPAIKVAGTTTNLLVVGHQGTVSGTTDVSDAPFQIWFEGSCRQFFGEKGEYTMREQDATPTTPSANRALLYSIDNGAGATQTNVVYPSGDVAILGVDGLGFQSKAANYTAVVTDRVVLVDATGAARTITLPAVATAKGQLLTVKKIDASANAVIVDGSGAETIENAMNITLYARWSAVTVYCTGSSWVTVASRAGAPFVGDQAPASFTIVDGEYGVHARRLALSGTQRATLAGTAQLCITGASS